MLECCSSLLSKCCIILSTPHTVSHWHCAVKLSLSFFVVVWTQHDHYQCFTLLQDNNFDAVVNSFVRVLFSNDTAAYEQQWSCHWNVQMMDPVSAVFPLWFLCYIAHLFMFMYALFCLGHMSHILSCFGAGVTNLNELHSSFLLPPYYCGLGVGSISFRAIVNNKLCKMRGLFMAPVTHDWIGDLKAPRVYPKWPILCRVAR